VREPLIEEGAEDRCFVEDELILLEVPGREKSVPHGGTDEPDPDRRFIFGGVAEELVRKLESDVSKLQLTGGVSWRGGRVW
jgi:hypothetical protein